MPQEQQVEDMYGNDLFQMNGLIMDPTIVAQVRAYQGPKGGCDVANVLDRALGCAESTNSHTLLHHPAHIHYRSNCRDGIGHEQ
jgi:hypothetical protein